MGDTFQQKGEPEKAKDAYTRGLEIEPDNIYLKDQVTKVGGQ